MASGGAPSAQFAVELDGSNAASGAKNAATALTDLREKISADLAALREMQAAMRRLQGGTSVNVAAFKKLKDEIAAKKASVAAAEERYVHLGGTYEKLKGQTTTARAGLGGLISELKSSGGAVGAYSGRLEGLVGMMNKLGGARVVAVAALAAVTAATVLAYGALAKYGLAQADAYRSETLRLEGLTKLRRWYGLAAGSASHLQSTIDQVSATAAIGRPQVAGYAQQLYMMGLRGKNLSSALEATVIKASTQGEKWASVFMNMAAGANMLGQSVQRMSDDVKARLGAIAEKQALGLSVQMMKLRQNVGLLFKDLKIEPMLKGLNEILSLFSQTTSTGRALKALLEVVLNPFFASAEGGAPIAKRFMQGLVIGALTIAIAFYKVRNALRDMFGGTWFSDTKKAELALKLGMGAAVVFVAVLGFLAAKLAIVAAGAALAAAPFIALAAIIAASFGYIISSIGALRRDWDILKKAPWGDLAKAMIDGIVDGITSGAKWVWNAISNLAEGAVKKFKEVLHIASPSIRMKAEARFVPAGAAGGIEEGIPQVERASLRMAKSVKFPKLQAPKLEAQAQQTKPRIVHYEARFQPFKAPRFESPRVEMRQQRRPAAEVQRPVLPRRREPIATETPRPRYIVTAPANPSPRPAESQRKPPKGPTGATGPLVQIGDLHVHSHATDVEGVKDDIRREVERIFEGVAVQLGALVT